MSRTKHIITMSSLELNTLYSQITVRKMQLNERHCTIMEAWDEKSKSKTNRTLARMYKDLWIELDEVNQNLKDIEAHRTARLKLSIQ